MTSIYPHALSYFVNRISNYSQNTTKVLPYLTNAVPSSQIVVCDLPTNALLDLRTFAWHFAMTTSATGTGNFAGAPQNIESIIDKVVVEINGRTLNSSANQNYVFNALLPLMGGTDLINKRKIYQNGGTIVAPTANLTNERFVISHWLGFLGSVLPDVIDTSALGNVRISIHLANNNVLVPASVSAGSSESYVLNDLYFTVNTLAIEDGTYYPLHAQYLASGAVIEMPFDSYYTSLFSATTWDNSVKFSLSSQSIDWLAAVAVPKYNTRSLVSAASGRGAMFDTSTVGCSSYSFSANGVEYPLFKAKVDESYTHTLNGLQQTHDVSNGITPLLDTKAKWLENFGVFLQAFAFPCGSNERTVSGLNTQGECCQLSFNTQSDGTAVNPKYIIMIAKTTSILRVGNQRSLEIVM